MIKKIFFLLSIIFFAQACALFKTSEEKYLDYIEEGIVSLYNGDNDYMKYFEKAYKQNPKDDLLYQIINSELEYKDLSKFYEKNKNKCKGYDYYFNGELAKAHSEGNLDASRALYISYYYSFQYKKAFNIMETTDISDSTDIYTDLKNNKDLFFKIEDIYNKLKNNKANEDEKELFKKFVVNYPVDVNLVYDVLKSEVEKKDNTALFIKYLTLDEDDAIALKILDYLFKNNYGPAIYEYVGKNKISDPSDELLDKIDKYSKQTYALLLNNMVESGDIGKIEQILKMIPDKEGYYSALAEFNYYYKDLNKAYSYFVKAYQCEPNSDYTVYRLANISKKLHKEKEFLNLTKNYKGEYEDLILNMKYEEKFSKVAKKRIALNMWIKNKNMGASYLLSLTKDKKKVACYTEVLKMYK